VIRDKQDECDLVEVERSHLVDEPPEPLVHHGHLLRVKHTDVVQLRLGVEPFDVALNRQEHVLAPVIGIVRTGDGRVVDRGGIPGLVRIETVHPEPERLLAIDPLPGLCSVFAPIGSYAPVAEILYPATLQ
jgi:hypothetical protein